MPRRRRARPLSSSRWPGTTAPWGEDIALLTARLDRVEAEAKTTEAEAKGIEEDFRGAPERLEIVGSNRALGQILTDKRKDLPDLRRYRKTIAEREEEIADTALARDPPPGRATRPARPGHLHGHGPGRYPRRPTARPP